jgi:hypothetical protein
VAVEGAGARIRTTREGQIHIELGSLIAGQPFEILLPKNVWVSRSSQLPIEAPEARPEAPHEPPSPCSYQRLRARSPGARSRRWSARTPGDSDRLGPRGTPAGGIWPASSSGSGDLWYGRASASVSGRLRARRCVASPLNGYHAATISTLCPSAICASAGGRPVCRDL